MNSLIKFLVAGLAAFDTVFLIISPIAIILFWYLLIGFNSWTSYLIVISGSLSSLYRGIKVGILNYDWRKHDRTRNE